jgi:hypothetical protein
MSNDSDWITAAVAKTRQKGPAVPDCVWSQLEAVLRGKFSARPIPAVELASLAMQLIEGMDVAPPRVKEPE